MRIVVLIVAVAVVALLLMGFSRRGRPAPEARVPGGPRAWALATTAHLTYRNGWRIDMLPPQIRSDSSVAETRQILRDWWEIENRADLLRTLDWLAHEGHRVNFQGHARPLAAMSDAQFQAAMARKSADEVRLMKLCREHYRKRGSGSLVAWDQCRYIMLCRCGYQLGFLTEREAWGRIMPVARTLQATFPSWADLGEDYLIGREYWSKEETERTGAYYRDLERWLVRDPNSPWNHLAWRMDLGTDATP